MVSTLREPRNLSVNITGWPYAPGANGGGAPTFDYDLERRFVYQDILPSHTDTVAAREYFIALTPDLTSLGTQPMSYSEQRTSTTYVPNGPVHSTDVLNVSDIGTIRFSPGQATTKPLTIGNSLLNLFTGTTLRYYVSPDPSVTGYWTDPYTFNYPTSDFMDTLRSITSGLGLEIIPVNDTLVVTTPDRIVYPSSVSDFKISTTVPAVVNALGIQWYDTNAITVPAQPHALPPVIYEQPDPITVKANEILDITITAHGVSGDMANLQPVCVAAIPQIPYLGGSGSIYCVTGADGYIVSPARWNGQGGRITVKRGNGAFEYILHVVGPKDESLSPYTITEGPDFPALYLVPQNGVNFTIMQQQVMTGATYDFANNVTVFQDPTFVDCPRITDVEQMWGAMFRLSRINNTTQYTATTTLVADTVLPSVSGKPPYYQIGGVPVPQLTAYRFYQSQHYWRPNQLNWKPVEQTVEVTCDEFTLCADFDKAFAGMTCLQWDTAMKNSSGLSSPVCEDFDAAPIFNEVHW